VAVVELGMNHAGEIRALTAIAEPDVRVWTNVGDAHLGFFGSRDAIADAKAEILEGADPSTLAVVNADDPLIAARVAGFRGTVRTFGFDERADVRASDVRDGGLAGMTASVRTPAGTAVMHPLLGLQTCRTCWPAPRSRSTDVPLHDIVIARRRRTATHREVIRLRDGGLVDDRTPEPTALAGCCR
jgi:UDP-N-acetylmuramoyl-tripeptide--D-alanyl-D-alanine ligase